MHPLGATGRTHLQQGHVVSQEDGAQGGTWLGLQGGHVQSTATQPPAAETRSWYSICHTAAASADQLYVYRMQAVASKSHVSP
jgi:hypothetical protein